MEVNTHKTLNWLLEQYHENPNMICDIAHSMEAGNAQDIKSIHQLGEHLVKKGFVKNHCFLVNGFTCSITSLGISQVSNVFVDVKYKILEGSIEGQKRSVMEILGIDPAHVKKVHDYATYLKRLGIIECIFHAHDVFAEPTFYGREWYHENKLKFVN